MKKKKNLCIEEDKKIERKMDRKTYGLLLLLEHIDLIPNDLIPESQPVVFEKGAKEYQTQGSEGYLRDTFLYVSFLELKLWELYLTDNSIVYKNLPNWNPDLYYRSICYGTVTSCR